MAYSEKMRKVFVVFHHNTSFMDRKLLIKSRGPVLAQVLEQLPTEQRNQVVGVLNQEKTAWID